MLSAVDATSRASALSTTNLTPATTTGLGGGLGGGSAGLVRTSDLSAPNARLQMLEGKLASGQQLSPVEQGEMARLRDDLGRNADLDGIIKDIVDKIMKALEGIKGAGKPQGPDKAEEPGKTGGPAKTDGPNADGTVKGAKTIDDFNLVGASEQDKKDFAEMLVYLQRAGPDGKAVSPTAVELLAKLPKGQTVKINNQHDDSYNPRTGEIAWDPRSALKVGGTDKYQSPALGFIHEVDHAVNLLKNPKPTGDGYENTEEKRVITGSETQIAHDLGEPTRTDHGGAVVHVKSATDHTDTPYTKPGKNHGGGGRMKPIPE